MLRFAFIFLLPTLCFAEEALQLKGITFPCTNCERFADDNCQITVDSTERLIDCDSAFVLLLKTTKNLLSVKELTRSIKRKDLPQEGLLPLYMALQDSSIPQNKLAVLLLELYRKDPTLLYSILPSLSAEMVDELSRASLAQGSYYYPLRVRLGSQFGTPALETLLDDISLASTDTRLFQLSELKKVYGDEEIGPLLNAVAECESDSLKYQARCEDLSKYPSQFRPFLLDLKAALFITAAEKSADWKGRLNWLSRISLEGRLTPKMHRIVEQSITEAVKEDLKLLLSPRYQELLSTFSLNNRQVQAILEDAYLIYLQNAEDFYSAVERLASLSYPPKFEVLDMGEPALIIKELLALRSSVGISVYIRGSEKLGGSELLGHHFSNSSFYLWGLLTLLSLAILVFWMRLRRPTQQIMPVLELQALLTEFGLPGNATATELKGAYRELAKREHPDSNPLSDDNHFAVLKEKYDRALKLLEA